MLKSTEIESQLRNEMTSYLKATGLDREPGLTATHLVEIEIEAAAILGFLSIFRKHARDGLTGLAQAAMVDAVMSLEHAREHMAVLLPQLKRELDLDN